jgi:hypothetical protein
VLQWAQEQQERDDDWTRVTERHPPSIALRGADRAEGDPSCGR